MSNFFDELSVPSYFERVGLMFVLKLMWKGFGVLADML